MPDTRLRSIHRWAAGELGGNVEFADDAFSVVWTSYMVPVRHYHTLSHALDVCERFKEICKRTEGCNLATGLLAAIYHDAVYKTVPGSQNEAGSAELAVSQLSHLGCTGTERVREAILATIHSAERPTDATSAALADADLAILAAPPDEYRRYAQLVRQEYASYSDEEWRRGRMEVLDRLLARPQLFWTAAGKEWEAAARANMNEEKRRLQH